MENKKRQKMNFFCSGTPAQLRKWTIWIASFHNSCAHSCGHNCFFTIPRRNHSRTAVSETQERLIEEDHHGISGSYDLNFFRCVVLCSVSQFSCPWEFLIEATMEPVLLAPSFYLKGIALCSPIPSVCKSGADKLSHLRQLKKVRRCKKKTQQGRKLSQSAMCAQISPNDSSSRSVGLLDINENSSATLL